MGQHVQTQIKAAPKSSSMSNQTGILQRKCACGQLTIAGGECAECQQGSQEVLQRVAVSTAPVNAVPAIVHDVLDSPGQPLDAETRSFMEPRFGHDFSQVRVHTDEQSAESAQAVNALAYTVEGDVVFGEGQYAPGTSEGKRLLAHELTHVVQQSRGGLAPELNPTAAHEQDAAAVAVAIASGQSRVPVQSATGVGLARANGKTPKFQALTPEELFMRLVQSPRGFASSPSGAPTNAPTSSLGKGYETFASIQIIDKEGNQVFTSVGAYLGGGQAHGETQAIAALEKNLPQEVPGGRVMVVVEQKPCPGCTSSLEAFADKLGVDELEVYVPARASKTGTGQVKPKTAATTSFRGDNPPTTLERVYQKRFRGGPIAEGVKTGKPATQSEAEGSVSSGSKVVSKTSQAEKAVEEAEGHIVSGSKVISKTTQAEKAVEESEGSVSSARRALSKTSQAERVVEEAPVGPVSTAIKGTLVNIGAAVVLNILTDKFHSYMLDQIAKMPKPKIDRRYVADYLADPNTRESMRVIDLLNKNIKPFSNELQEHHLSLIGATNAELGVLTVSGVPTHQRVEHLKVIQDQHIIYQQQLFTVFDNLNAALRLEETALERAKAAEQLANLVERAFVADQLLKMGFDIDEIVDIWSNLIGFSKNIRTTFQDIKDLRNLVMKLSDEESRFAKDINRLYWSEILREGMEIKQAQEKAGGASTKP